MRIKRRTEISIEQREVVVLRRRGSAVVWCMECGARAVSPEEAAAVMGISLRAVFRQVEAGRLHPYETEEGTLFICLNSLPPQDGKGDRCNENDEI